MKRHMYLFTHLGHGLQIFIGAKTGERRTEKSEIGLHVFCLMNIQ